MTADPEERGREAVLDRHEADAGQIGQENRGIPWAEGPDPDYEARESRPGPRADPDGPEAGQ